MAKDAAKRVLADLAVIGFGFLTSLVTARVLGPAGRGTLATLTFLAGLLGVMATVGLAEVTVVWFKRRGMSLKETVAAVVPPVAVGNVLAVIALIAVSLIALPGTRDVHGALIAACVTVVVASTAWVLARALNASGNFGVTSAGLATQSGVAMLATLLFLIPLHLGVFGAVAAVAIGTLAGALVLAPRSRAVGLTLIPRFDRRFLAAALPYGSRVLLADALELVAARFDLFLVYLIVGHAAAGEYSIALTISGMVGLAPFALGYVTFQRIASRSGDDALSLTAQSCRAGVVLAGGTAVTLGIAAVPLIPIVFGSSYAAAVAPSLLLILGTLIASIAVLLARAVAAQGDPRLSLYVGITTVGIMVVADLALLPMVGIVGAGVGWCIAGVCALAVCCFQYARRTGASALGQFVPTKRDLSFVTDAVRRLLVTRFAAQAARRSG